jgi:hypothetical protein
MKNVGSITLNIMIKKEGKEFIAHCLELDIVATAKTKKSVIDDMISLITAQIEYAFLNDNLAYLFRPAPSEIWEEFYSCKGVAKRGVIKIKQKSNEISHRFVPPILTTNICIANSLSPSCAI